MATRLDRLFLLLDTGSTAVARKAAAQQLGEVQKLHPHELHNLLAKVHGYLRSTSWETRIAAGLAVEAICKNVPEWQPKPAAKQGEDEEHSCGCSDPPPPGFQLTFATFDLDRVLRHGAALLGSEGDEYDMALQEFSGLEQKERLLRQRQILNKRLGLDVAGSLGVETGELFTDEDLISHSQPLTPTTEKQQEVIQLSQMLPSMSNREKNIAKRKAKTLAKQRSRDLQPTEPGSQPSEQPCKKRRTANVLVEQPADDEKLVIDSVPDNALFWEQNEEWPFELFCESLTYDLFSTHWEVRHGAAIGLREVLRQHAGGAGRTPGMDAAQQEGATQRYLEDIALRTTCVLALDKFGDFVSDEVVAPVRESCAQALGIVLSVMREDAVVSVMNILITLLRQEQWEARHGALLGLKYLLAVRKELTAKLLPEVFPSVFAGLQDSCDDVSAVSAAALAPVADDIVNFLPDQVTSLITCLWDLLLDLDDLTAATNSMMSLLSSLLANSHVSYTHRGAELHELVPRLWPFLGHSIKSVRRSALATLQTLVAMENTEPPVNVWLPQVLQEALRTLFQRCIVESNQEILHIVYETWCAVLERAPQEAVAAAACPWINVWLCLMMQPAKVAIDHSLVIVARTQPERSGKVKPTAADPVVAVEDDRDYIGGKLTLTAAPVDHDAGVVRARSYAAKCLGKLAMIVSAPQASYPEGVETPLEGFCKLICFHLNSKSATQRLCTALLVSEWSQADVTLTLPDAITVKLRESVNESVYFDEIAPLFTRMQAEAKDLVATLTKNNAELDASYTGSVLTIEQALALSSSTTWRQLSTSASFHGVEEKQRCLAVIATHTQAGQHMLNVRVQACLAVALIVLKSLPDKLNPVIRPLMDSLKQEENIQLQLLSAWGLARVMEQCIDRHPSPNTKIVKNLCSIVCAAATPVTGPSTTGDDSDTSESGSQTPTLVLPSIVSDRFCGILTLVKQQKACDKLAPRRYKKGGTINVDANIVEEVIDEQQKQMATQRRGAQFGLSSMAQYFGAALFDKLPVLWEAINHCSLTQVAASSSQNGLSGGEEQARELANSLHVLETVGPALHPQLHDKLLGLSLRVCDCLRDRFTAVRHRAARCLAMLAKVCGLPAMTVVLEQVLPLLGTTDSDVCRQGAVEALANVIELLDFEIVPYIVLLVLPVLGRISDHNENIRLMATQCFASLIRLMPLESGIVDPPELKPCLVEQKARQRCFMQQLLDSNKADDYKVPVPIHAELRKYQQDGVNWLAFLNKYKLHGILCDDMGLGKTLQSLCILAGDHHLREKAYKETGSADCMPLPSIVVCPPTLTGHWVYEIQKFVACQYLNPLHYTGPPVERARLKPQLRRHNLVIASYDIVRNDIDFFSGVKWNYCILDEGHIIKNGKTKISKAVKQLQACHRLILSGTPIQNNVLELWSLFDFLMPGLLGSERAFTARYGRPILQSRDAKSSMKEQEAGVLAMEALHRQVLPFLLRRMKDDVLQDLPPKIMQDYYCELSTLQVQLYEDFAKSRARVDAEEQMGASEAARPHSHVFQCLQYLRKVCNHPLLVLQPDHPLYRQIADQLDRTATSLCSLQHSGKLVALRQLLQDCGIGVGERAPAEAVVGEHRALVFCQFKSMLDIVEKHLLKPHMPSLTYLRLDGSIPAGSRHSIVNRFNNDPSIDVLLLTTHVGGLGLNLTGADTVIFVEHDWNPMKDLQAMDRAHRIGQKKVVNVYRLITKGTLEEKIMSLQKFKINIANTVISQDNSSLLSMATDQLLDLFALDNDWQETKADQSDDSRQSMKQVLENLGDLWDEKQYEEEYDLGTFMQALHK